MALGQSSTKLTQAFQILQPSPQGPAGGPPGKAFTETQIEKDLLPLLPARSRETPRHAGCSQHICPQCPEGAESASHTQRPWWPCSVDRHQSQVLQMLPQPLLLLHPCSSPSLQLSTAPPTSGMSSAHPCLAVSLHVSPAAVSPELQLPRAPLPAGTAGQAFTWSVFMDQ